MAAQDRFGLPLSCEDAAAVADYVTAVDLMLAAWRGAEALLDRALDAAPDFALAHIAQARLLQQQVRLPEAKTAAARAEALAERLTGRANAATSPSSRG